MQIRDQPVLTEVYSDAEQFRPKKDSAYVCGLFSEHRVPKIHTWEADSPDVLVARVIDQQTNEITVSMKGGVSTVPLRSTTHLKDFWCVVNRQSAYLDITGLAHHVWAPLLKSALSHGTRLDVVYREPMGYRFSITPTEGEIFDLSERITGIAPLPGFASLRDPMVITSVSYPCSGSRGHGWHIYWSKFSRQGRRSSQSLASPVSVWSILFFTYLGNQSPLVTTKAWKSVRFATANNPFSLFYLLGDISQHFPSEQLKIAPIGTKPHALGAVLFALTQPSRVELVYDHPLRRKDRTQGTARVLVYHVSVFLN